MKSFALSLGKLTLAFCLAMFISPAGSAWSSYDSEPPSPWKISLLAVGTSAAVIGIAQLDNSEIIFASIYGTGAAVYTHHLSTQNTSSFADFVIPVGLASLAIANLTLLKNDEESKSSIAGTNVAALGLLSLYWYYFEAPWNRMSTPYGAQLSPWITSESTGLVAYFDF